MRWLPAIVSLGLVSGCGGGGGGTSPAPVSKWIALRANAAPVVALPDEFDTAQVQPMAIDGWEDGIAISRDGLHLYAVYVPCDLLGFTLDGAPQAEAANWFRGPTLGMDLVTSPVATDHWIHGNIIHASRASTAVDFGPWQLTTMARPIWSEGAPQTQGDLGSTWDFFVYTTNEHPTDYKAHICIARGAAFDPISLGTILPAPVTTATTEDNPHLERLDASNLVLFFDSDDRPGGLGSHDIWYATSADDGVTWATPLLVASVSTASAQEHQPHLWQDGDGLWWLYFSATNSADGKLGIFRMQQGTPGDWDSWTTRELVLGAGNTAGVGEPTLASNGDLSFVVVLEDPAGTATDRYDADPWFLPRLPSGVTTRGRTMRQVVAAIIP